MERLEAVDEFVLMPNGLRRFPPLIRVIFSTDRDLTSYSLVYANSFVLDASLCQQDGQTDPHRMVSHSEVLTPTGVAVDSYQPTDASNPARQDRRYVYHFYLDARSRAGQLSPDRIRVEHDLRQNNDDICFTFLGGSILALPHRSPDFRIPYALIADALARAGLPHASVTSGS